MITVSINVPVIDTRPCLTGSFVLAAAAAIGALPRPASLENIPLATPLDMAASIAPTKPPPAALRPKAYIIAIKGTSFSEILAILDIPPMITTITIAVTTIAAITVAMDTSFPKILTVCSILGSAKFCTADAIPFI